MLRKFAWILVGVIVLALASAQTLRKVSRWFLFPVSRVATARAPDGFVEQTTTARDGVIVRALELEGAPSSPVVVYFHTNRETAASRTDLARELGARGFGVLLVEYRGYGASRGEAPSEEGLYLDAEAALDLLAERGIATDRIVLVGASLGSGVAAEMARRKRGARLVLVAPYTSIPDLVTDVAPFVPARLLLADHFDTREKAGEIRVPTLVIHGDADEIVPFHMGRDLARAIPSAMLLRVPDGRHGDLFARGGARLLDTIASFAR